jgi:hypothetical protein
MPFNDMNILYPESCERISFISLFSSLNTSDKSNWTATYNENVNFSHSHAMVEADQGIQLLDRGIFLLSQRAISVWLAERPKLRR